MCIVKWVQDHITRYSDLASGSSQVAGILSAHWPLIQQSPQTYSYFTMPAKSMLFVGIAMNTLRYPTNITAVRDAIVHAINYTAISNQVFFGGLNPMMGPEYPAQSQYYELGNLPPYQYNLPEAQAFMKQSGVNTANLPALEFRVVAGCSYCESAAE